jgi:hypothetical protein
LQVKLPGDFRWTDEWRIDKTYTTTDADGWSYAGTFAALESSLERGESSGANSTFDMARRRRWVRTSQRHEGSVRRLDGDEHVFDFNVAGVIVVEGVVVAGQTTPTCLEAAAQGLAGLAPSMTTPLETTACEGISSLC